MIKKIIFKNLSTSLNYLAIGGIRFYDEDGLVIPSGKFLYQNGNDFIMENFITNASMPAYSVNYHSYKAFDTDIQPTSGCFNSSGKITNGQLSCTFKTPIKTIYKIDFMANYFREVRAGVTEPFSIEIIDENDKVIQSYSATPVLTTYVTQTILTPELNLSQKYLIKSQNKINTLFEFEGILTDITENIADINNITEEEYKQYGMNSLENIPVDFLNQLDEFEILSWTTDLEETPKLEFIVSEYKPIMVLHGPEIVTMTNTENPQLHIEGFRDLRPYCESENSNLLILSQSKPNIYTNLIPDPQLILPKGDIQFKMLDKVLSFNMTATEQNKGLIRLIFSIDSGTTWQTYNSNTLEFKQIDIQDLEIVENDGMTVDIFNSIGTKWNEVVQNSKIRFGYYLKIDDMSGVANVDKLEVTIDVLGVWDATLHEVDYDYEYDNEKIYIELYRDGSYKINYI